MMRLLSQFGEIEYFKSLRHDALTAPNTALLIYKEENAVRECLKRSPVRFRMGRAGQKEKRGFEEEQPIQPNAWASASATSSETPLPRGPVGTPFGLPAQSRSLSTNHSPLPTPPPNPIRMPLDPPPQPEEGNESRTFQIQANRSHRRFRDQINMGHYHGSFALDTKMVGQEDLARKVPLKGLSCVDWRAVEKPWWVANAERENERKGVRRRRRLGELWEEGVKYRDEGLRHEALPFG